MSREQIDYSDGHDDFVGGKPSLAQRMVVPIAVHGGISVVTESAGSRPRSARWPFPENSLWCARRKPCSATATLISWIESYALRFGSLAQLVGQEGLQRAMRNYFVSLIWTCGSNS